MHSGRVIGDWWTSRKNSDKADRHIEAADDDGLLPNTSSKRYHWLLIFQQQDWAWINVDVTERQQPLPADTFHRFGRQKLVGNEHVQNHQRR